MITKSRRRGLGRAVALGGALMLGGCAGEGGFDSVFSVNPIAEGDLPQVRARGDASRVVVYGGDPAGAAAAIALPQELGGGGFAAAPPEARGSRLALAFGSAAPNAMCEGTAAVAPSDPPTATLTWCIGDRPVAAATLRGPALAGPQADGFGPAVKTGLATMLRPEPPRSGR